MSSSLTIAFDWLVVVRIQKQAFRKDAVMRGREKRKRRTGFATEPSENNKVLNNVAAKGKDWYLTDGPLFGGERAIPEKGVGSVAGGDERNKRKGKKTGAGGAVGRGGGDFL